MEATVKRDREAVGPMRCCRFARGGCRAARHECDTNTNTSSRATGSDMLPCILDSGFAVCCRASEPIVDKLSRVNIHDTRLTRSAPVCAGD
jgi:hypothetical protein